MKRWRGAVMLLILLFLAPVVSAVDVSTTAESGEFLTLYASTGGDTIIPLVAGVLLLLALFIVLITIRRIRYAPEETYFW
ncbi:MAG: hypothetical protein QW567_00645 [Candidatus Hadarchaeales archaeon]